MDSSERGAHAQGGEQGSEAGVVGLAVCGGEGKLVFTLAGIFFCGVTEAQEDDFLGISYGIFKGLGASAYIDEETGRPGHGREQIVEVVYSLQVNDYLRIMPHYQFIQNPAYRSAGNESIWGVQTVFSF